jgi:hypothetical protein
MAYGLDLGLFLENGPAVEAERASRFRSARAFAAWRSLDPNTRYAAVEQALHAPCNDNPFGGLPIAL